MMPYRHNILIFSSDWYTTIDKYKLGTYIYLHDILIYLILHIIHIRDYGNKPLYDVF